MSESEKSDPYRPPLRNKKPHAERGNEIARLSSSRITLPDLAPYRFTAGCRGFVGPVPPPLWISAPLGLLNCMLIINQIEI